MHLTDAKAEYEKMLESNFLVFVNDQSKQPSSDDLTIDIEVPTTSQDLGGAATTSATLLQEEEEDKTSNSDDQMDKVTPKIRSSRQTAAIQNIELKVSQKALDLDI